MEASELRSYFKTKYGVTGLDHAKELLKELEKLPKEAFLSKPITNLRTDLAEIVMMGSQPYY